MNTIQLDVRTKHINNEILHFDEIDSTNQYLLDHELPHGTVALADYQSAGRGRLARKWQASKSDALLFSLSLSQHLQQIHPAGFSFLASIAVYEGLRSIYYQLPLALKWPNDVIVNGHKICGILVESRSAGSEMTKVVLGIGVNINQGTEFFQQDGLHHGTSLKLETGQEGDRFYILKSILESMEQNIEFAINRDIDEIVEKWKNYCPYIGKHIKLLERGKEHPGIFEDLDHEGGIILNHNGERKTYYAADVSIDKDYM